MVISRACDVVGREPRSPAISRFLTRADLTLAAADSLARSTASTRPIDFETRRRRVKGGGGKRGGRQERRWNAGVNKDEDGGCGGDEERRDRRRQHFWNTQTRWRRPDCTTLLESIRQSSLWTGWERRRSECGVKDEAGVREREGGRRERERQRKSVKSRRAGTSLCESYTYAGKITDSFSRNITRNIKPSRK